MEKTRLELNQIILLSIGFSIFVLAARVVYTGRFSYVFLIWNIFLAIIPYTISSYLRTSKTISKTALIVWLSIWLLFFPNAPYIITDLIHLSVPKIAPTWFDALLILSFAWNGIVLASISLFDVHKLLKKHLSAKISWLIVSFALLLSSFGIYLGRFLRWNSWDILSNPIGLFRDIFGRVANPLIHPRTWIVTTLFFVFFWLGYLLMIKFSEFTNADC